MSLTFNGHFLVEKLARLDSSQLSIQTLSHWCRFHRTKAKELVETWAGQFHCSPREQRLAFLYLANDILQNSRRKGPEFIVEFWKVLPNTFRDIIGIWEERKVFDIQGKVLKDELMGQSVEKSNRDGETLSRKLIGVGEENKLSDIQGKVLKKDESMGCSIEKSNGDGDTLGRKLRRSVGSMVDKIILSYEIVYDGPVDEESLLRKCGKAIAFIDKVDKEIGSDNSAETIEQLSAAESSRTNQVSRLREALQEQELKLVQIRLQEKVENICQHLINCKSGERLNETSIAVSPPSFTSETLGADGDVKGRPAPIITTGTTILQIFFLHGRRYSEICSSAEDYIGHQQNHASAFVKYPSEKRTKLVNGAPSYIQSQQLASEPLSYIPLPGSPQHLSSSPVALPLVPLQNPFSYGMPIP
ncbi:hypothetical protein MKX01_035935 [Papaver californicum]|nr:hypothetical protein MKX01_035935 [Papaver californicum]